MPTEWIDSRKLSPEKIKAMVTPYAKLLNHYIQHPYLHPEKFSKFDALTMPDIPLKEYLVRLTQYLDLTESHLLAMLFYIIKYQKVSNFKPLTSVNIHRIVAASVLLAMNILNDHAYKLGYIAKIMGFSIQIITELELFLFNSLSYDAWCQREILEIYRTNLNEFSENKNIHVFDKYFKPPSLPNIPWIKNSFFLNLNSEEGEPEMPDMNDLKVSKGSSEDNHESCGSSC